MTQRDLRCAIIALLALTYVSPPLFFALKTRRNLFVCLPSYADGNAPVLYDSHAVSDSKKNIQAWLAPRPNANSRGRDKTKNKASVVTTSAACRRHSRCEPSALFLVRECRDPRLYSVYQNLRFLLGFAALLAQA